MAILAIKWNPSPSQIKIGKVCFVAFLSLGDKVKYAGQVTDFDVTRTYGMGRDGFDNLQTVNDNIDFQVFSYFKPFLLCALLLFRLDFSRHYTVLSDKIC